MKTRYVATAGLAIAIIGTAAAQSKVVHEDPKELLSQLSANGIPLVLKVQYLKDDFIALKLPGNAGLSWGEIFGIGRLQSNAGFSKVLNDPTQEAFALECLSVVWYRGDILEMGGTRFMITYILDISDPSTLRLRLFDMGKVAAFDPRPDLLASRLRSLKFPASSADDQPGQARAKAQSQSASVPGFSNGKQLGTAIFMLLNDNDDIFPYVQDTGTLKGLVYPYTKSEALWDTKNPGSRFLFNMALAGSSASAIDAMSETIMLFESAPAADGTRIIVFADAHAKRVDEAEWRKIEPTLHLKLPKVTKPLPVGSKVPILTPPFAPVQPPKKGKKGKGG